MILRPDRTLQNADWVKSLGSDLGSDSEALRGLLAANGVTPEHWATLPASQTAVRVYHAVHDQKTHGRRHGLHEMETDIDFAAGVDMEMSEAMDAWIDGSADWKGLNRFGPGPVREMQLAAREIMEGTPADVLMRDPSYPCPKAAEAAAVVLAGIERSSPAPEMYRRVECSPKTARRLFKPGEEVDLSLQSFTPNQGWLDREWMPFEHNTIDICLLAGAKAYDTKAHAVRLDNQKFQGMPAYQAADERITAGRFAVVGFEKRENGRLQVTLEQVFSPSGYYNPESGAGASVPEETIRPELQYAEYERLLSPQDELLNRSPFRRAPVKPYHLPGRHDQKEHGRRGAGVAADTAVLYDDPPLAGCIPARVSPSMSEAEFTRRHPGTAVDLSGVDPQLAEEQLGRLDDLMQRYPEVEVKYLKADDLDFGQGYYDESGRGILLSRRDFSDRASYMEMAAYHEERRWFVAGSHSTQSVVTHEFAHGVWYQSGPELNPIKNRVRETTEDYFRGRYDDPAPIRRGAPSLYSYSGYDPGEMFAETFTLMEIAPRRQWVPLAVELDQALSHRAYHLPGQHDQRKHGRRGSSSGAPRVTEHTQFDEMAGLLQNPQFVSPGGVKWVGADALSPEYRQALVDEMDKMVAAYPDTVLKGVIVADDSKMDMGFAMTMQTGEGAIVLLPTGWWGPGQEDYLQVTWAQNCLVGWHPPYLLANPVSGNIDHEFGHVVMASMSKKQADEALYWQSLGMSRGEAPSDYATQDPYEYWAESFCFRRTGGHWQSSDVQRKLQAIEDDVRVNPAHVSGDEGFLTSMGYAEEYHLPGQHEQRLHGRKGVGGQPPVCLSATAPDAKKWRKENQGRYDTDQDFADLQDACTLWTQGGYDKLIWASRAAVTGEPVTKEHLEAGWGYEPDPAKRHPNQALGLPMTTAHPIFSDVKNYFEGQNLNDHTVQRRTLADAGVLMQKAISGSAPLQQPIYRGVRPQGWPSKPGHEIPKPGQIIDVPYVMSATTDAKLARSFAHGYATGQPKGHRSAEGVVYEIRPGAKGYPVGHVSPWRQSEVITSGRFRVVSVESQEDYLFSQPGRRNTRGEAGRTTVVVLEQVGTWRVGETPDIQPPPQTPQEGVV